MKIKHLSQRKLMASGLVLTGIVLGATERAMRRSTSAWPLKFAQNSEGQ
jgi:hypothetical protein